MGQGKAFDSAPDADLVENHSQQATAVPGR